MTNNLAEITASLINLRTIKNSQSNIWRQVHNRELVRLAPSWAIPAAMLNKLPLYQRRWITAYAHGRNAYRAVLAGKSAARMQGMWVINRKTELVELMLPSGNLPAPKLWPQGAHYRRGALALEEISQINGVRVTHVIRTAIDIARCHGFCEGVVAFDYLLKRGLTKAQLEEHVSAMGKNHNLKVAREAIAAATSSSGSPMESYARALLVRAGITVFSLQKQIGPYYVDFHFPPALIVEIDGFEKYDGSTHGPTDAAIFKEREREKYLTNLGFRVLRYSSNDLLNQPDRFIEQVRSELAKHA
ncbi:endonuclease domain-containing protein [Corynebacterium lubricantis]|uniref:endonuclease domain-containing protein n=1 Tax=Corynebacterium lubricantis TaxID=541095 RepID=UPI000365AC2D|nr:DUF559 domain-containing protein [Corynebacterium lubricantis]